MPRKRPRKNIPVFFIDDEKSDVSALGKKAYVVFFALILSYSILSLFLRPATSEVEIIKSVSSRRYSSIGRSGIAASGLQITINTNLGNEYFISTSGGQPFSRHDTILTFSNILFKKVGLQKKQYYYEFRRQFILLILIVVVSIAGVIYTMSGITVFLSALHIIVGLDGILLLIYRWN